VADTQQIGIAVPAQLIEDLVRAAIVRELGNQEALIAGVVTAALQQKDKDRYRGETLFQTMTEKMILGVAQDCMKTWVEENREKIRAAFLKHLNSRDGAALKKLAEGMVDGLSRYNVSVAFEWDNG
jgi:hypothetical protein